MTRTALSAVLVLVATVLTSNPAAADKTGSKPADGTTPPPRDAKSYQTELDCLGGATLYEKMSRLWAIAGPLHLAEATGTWTGRWFIPGSPMATLGALIVLDRRSTAVRGPVFANDFTYAYFTDSVADKFDRLPAGELQNYRKAGQASADKWYLPTVDNHDILFNRVAGNYSVRLRRWEDFIVLRAESMSGNTPFYQYAYFFHRLAE